MLRRRTICSAAVLAVVLLLPSVSKAQYTWPTVVPADGATNIAQPISVGTILNWTGGTTVSSMNAAITVVGGYTGMTTSNITTNSGSGSATFTGKVTFSPPLASGTQVQIKYDVIMSDFSTQTKSTTFTIK